MILTIEELKAGDEVLVPKMSVLIHAKLLKDPEPAKKQPHWARKIYYKSIKCKVNVNVLTEEFKGWDDKSFFKKRKEYFFDPKGYNNEEYINFNGKSVWLLHRNNK